MNIYYEPMNKTPLERAIEISGGQTKLAHDIGTTQQGIYYWLKKNNVPAEFCVKIEEVTGVPKYELRPDIFTA